MKRIACIAVPCFAIALLAATPPAAAEETKRKSPLLAAGLNFFIPGAGYAYNGEKPLYVSLPLIAGAVGLTYLENFHKYGPEDETLREHDGTAFALLFSTVFVINTALAIDAYREASAINRGETKKWAVGLGRNRDGSGLRLQLSTRF